MSITPSQLRRDLYRLLDEVLDTGEPIEINRGGRLLRVVSGGATGSRLARIRSNPGGIVGDPDDLVEIDWSQHWRPGG